MRAVDYSPTCGIDRLKKLYKSKIPASEIDNSSQMYEEKRASNRQACFNDAWIDADTRVSAIPATILNHSSTGLLISADCPKSIPNAFKITTGLMQFEVSVAWRNQNLIGTRIVKVTQECPSQIARVDQRKAVSDLIFEMRRALALQGNTKHMPSQTA
jgi:hypothetical protein